jgi:hypothetical protein
MTYDEAIENAALAALIKEDVIPFVREAMQLRGGIANADLVSAAVAKQVATDIAERAMLLLSTEIAPALRVEMPDIADAFEAKTSQQLREILADIAKQWPTRN